jgi:hypothetical protein
MSQGGPLLRPILKRCEKRRCVNGIGKEGDMQTAERVTARPVPPLRLEEKRPAPVRQEPRPEVTLEHLLLRVIVVGVGFGIALTGFMLMLSIFLVFIGFPLFFVGLAVMEVGLKGWQ